MANGLAKGTTAHGWRYLRWDEGDYLYHGWSRKQGEFTVRARVVLEVFARLCAGFAGDPRYTDDADQRAIVYRVC